MTSETKSCRSVLAKWCEHGNGLDIGHGGMRPIVDHAICLDRGFGYPDYAASDPWPTTLKWDAFTSLPFKDGLLDFVFSSHCLEDSEDPARVMTEWVRVLRFGGRLVLFLPDQQTYEKCCYAAGTVPNGAHKFPDFSLEFVKARLPGNVKVVHEQFPFPGNPYSFALVAEKLPP